MIRTIEYLKSGNYEVVDNQGVSVTQHFIQCLEKEFADLLEKEFADLETKLEEKKKEVEKLKITLNLQAIQASEEQRLSLINTNCIQYNQNQEEVLKELTNAVVVAIDLLGIDIKKAYPKLYNKFLTQQHEDKGE